MTLNAPAIDNQTSQHLHELARAMQGKLDLSSLGRTLYSTDASAYQETPLAVAFPETEADIGLLIRFANEHRDWIDSSDRWYFFGRASCWQWDRG